MDTMRVQFYKSETNAYSELVRSPKPFLDTGVKFVRSTSDGMIVELRKGQVACTVDVLTVCATGGQTYGVKQVINLINKPMITLRLVYENA